jgi:acetate---CoA ligase (ADP-forming)
MIDTDSTCIGDPILAAKTGGILQSGITNQLSTNECTNAKLDKLLRPKTVAVIGASGDAGKTAGRPVAYLQKHGFAGAIYPVNPKLTELVTPHGILPCYASIDVLPEIPDVAIVLLGAKNTIAAVKALSEKGCSAAIVLASGFGETGDRGAELQMELKQAAGAMRLLGPNTLGLVNLTDKIILSASGALELDTFPTGAVGVVSQSGGVLSAILSRSASRGLGLSKLISTSNEVDLELSDFIDYLVDDPTTRVIALYIETVRDPERFRRAANRAALAGKPIVAFKVGRSEAGARAAVSHTGAMAGSDRMYDAFFTSIGVHRAQNFSDLLNVASILSTNRRLHGKRVAILTSTGGAGTLVCDSLGLAGFETPNPDARTVVALQKVAVAGISIPSGLDSNPLDVTLAGLQPDFLSGLCKALMTSDQYDALCVIVGASGISNPRLMADAISSQLHLSKKPVFAYVSPHAPHVVPVLMAAGIPVFTEAEHCAIALRALWEHSKKSETSLPCVQSLAKHECAVISTSAISHRGSLNEFQAKQLFLDFGIPCVRERIVLHDEQLQFANVDFGDRVVLKILSDTIMHKSEVGGVSIGVETAHLAKAMHDMHTQVLRSTGQFTQQFVIQEMITDGLEFMIGLRRDPLGSAVLLGMGGVTAELMQDYVLLMLPADMPLSHEQIIGALLQLKMWPLLDGYRGRTKADVPALVNAISCFADMAQNLDPNLIEAEINPIFVFEEGHGVKAADGIARFISATTSD